MNKIVLGPIQTQWIADLRAHPERQTTGRPGYVDEADGSFHFCCLGQALVTLCTLQDKPWPLNEEGRLHSGHLNGVLFDHYKELGLNSATGSFMRGYQTTTKYGTQTYFGLAEMNDGGQTWAQIADYIEANPDNVFVASM